MRLGTRFFFFTAISPPPATQYIACGRPVNIFVMNTVGYEYSLRPSFI